MYELWVLLIGVLGDVTCYPNNVQQAPSCPHTFRNLRTSLSAATESASHIKRRKLPRVQMAVLTATFFLSVWRNFRYKRSPNDINHFFVVSNVCFETFSSYRARTDMNLSSNWPSLCVLLPPDLRFVSHDVYFEKIWKYWILDPLKIAFWTSTPA